MRIADLLRTVGLFNDLISSDLNELAVRVREHRPRAGERLFDEDQPRQALFIVVDGMVELVRPRTPDRAAETRRLSAGEWFGEAAIISGETEICSATAVVDSHVLELDKDEFDAFAVARPWIMRSVVAALSRSAIESNQQLLSEEPRGGPAGPPSRVYSVFSPRGGSGKSLIAARLAVKLAQLMPQRVALLDLDLLFDDAVFELGADVQVSLGGLPEHELQVLDARSVARLAVEHPSGLRLIAGCKHPEEGERINAEHVHKLIAALKRQFLVTVVDCGGTFSEPVMAALEGSDGIVVICTPELATLRDLRDCQRLFGQALHLDVKRVQYVLNHPLPSVGLTRRQFEDALDHPIMLEIEHAGAAATNPSFAKAIERIAADLVSTDALRTEHATAGTAGAAEPAGSGFGRFARRLLGTHAR